MGFFQLNTTLLFSAGSQVRNDVDKRARFAIILYDRYSGNCVFSARRWTNNAGNVIVNGYICQRQQQQRQYNIPFYHANAFTARYCVTKSVSPSVQCRYSTVYYGGTVASGFCSSFRLTCASVSVGSFGPAEYIICF